MCRRAIAFREQILKHRPTGAVGFLLWFAPLHLSFPPPGITLRSTGRREQHPYFNIDPYESPMVPLSGSYTLSWVNPAAPGGGRWPQLPVVINFISELTHPLVTKQLKVFQREKRLENKQLALAESQTVGVLLRDMQEGARSRNVDHSPSKALVARRPRPR